jgi:glycosyltransferase involved in cell wall biosynthesis
VKLGFVIQRYGRDLSGGAEFECRALAERLSARDEIEVFTTCATDYLTWRNDLAAGTELQGAIRVTRYPVDRVRDVNSFSAWTERVLGWKAAHEPGASEPEVAASASWEDCERWLVEQGPHSPALVEAVRRRQSEFDAFAFWSYRYFPTVHGMPAVAGKAVHVPTAEDDGVWRLPVFPPLFRLPRATVYNAPEERDLIGRACSGFEPPGDVLGVGIEEPPPMDPEGFRRRQGIDGPFLLYVGRVDRNKGCPELLDFFCRYRRETNSPLRLVLMGRAVLKVPTGEGIVALGFQPEAEKWNALAASMALVIPSRLESLSIVTLEAFRAERPVLASSRCEVLRGHCRRSNGGLYYWTYEEFKESLTLLEADAELRRQMGLSGRAYCESHYTWDVLEPGYRRLMEAAAEGREPRGATLEATT